MSYSYHRTYRYDSYNDKPIYDFDAVIEEPVVPRQQHKFPQDNTCPQCGKTDTTRTDTYFHCTCGCILWNEDPIPYREDTIGVSRKWERTVVRAYREVPCARCGEPVSTNANTSKVYCEDCREITLKEGQKRWRETYKSKGRKR